MLEIDLALGCFQRILFVEIGDGRRLLCLLDLLTCNAMHVVQDYQHSDEDRKKDRREGNVVFLVLIRHADPSDRFQELNQKQNASGKLGTHKEER